MPTRSAGMPFAHATSPWRKPGAHRGNPALHHRHPPDDPSEQALGAPNAHPEGSRPRLAQHEPRTGASRAQPYQSQNQCAMPTQSAGTPLAHATSPWRKPGAHRGNPSNHHRHPPRGAFTGRRQTTKFTPRLSPVPHRRRRRTAKREAEVAPRRTERHRRSGESWKSHLPTAPTLSPLSACSQSPASELQRSSFAHEHVAPRSPLDAPPPLHASPPLHRS